MNKIAPIILPVVAALIVVATGTYLQGVWSERWWRHRSERLKEFTSRLADVPMVIGDWEGVDQPVDEEQFKRSNCDGQVSRKYTNDRGDSVSVFLVSGTGRHVTIHTPDWCYRGAGYEMDKNPHPYKIDVDGMDPSPEFSTTTFTKHDATGASDRLRIFWSFTEDGRWQGPAAPKPMFGSRDALYKVYLITDAKDRRESPEDSPTIEFAKEFFPVVNELLFRAPDKEAEPAEAGEAVAAK